MDIEGIERVLRLLAPSADPRPVLDNLINLFDNGQCIEDYFKPIGSGSFKEAYYSGIDGVVFKFCSIQNPTQSERILLEAATEEEVEEFFVPTYFFRIPEKFIGSFLADEDSDKYIYSFTNHKYTENPDWEAPIFRYLEVQPFVDCITRREPIPKYDPLDLYNKLPIGDESWLSYAYQAYGGEKLKRFAQFCIDYAVDDLHGGNIGYYNGRPIIMDWLSAASN